MFKTIFSPQLFQSAAEKVGKVISVDHVKNFRSNCNQTFRIFVIYKQAKSL